MDLLLVGFVSVNAGTGKSTSLAKGLARLGIIFFVHSLCAACAALAERCAGIPAGADSAGCNPSTTFVLKKPIQPVNLGGSQGNSSMEIRVGDPESGASFEPQNLENSDSADVSERNNATAGNQPPTWAHVFSYSKTPRVPRKPPVCSDTASAGSDQAEKYDIDFGGRPGKATFLWDTYTVKDQMKVYVDDVVVVDTGCVGEQESKEFEIPK